MRADEMAHLENMGVLSDIASIEGQLSSGLALGVPPPPPIMDGILPPPGSLPPPDIDSLADEDLLEKMANPAFFGEIPSAVGNLLDQLAGTLNLRCNSE